MQWRDGRVVDRGGLENRWSVSFRGFESLSLREYQKALKISAFLFDGKNTMSNLALLDPRLHSFNYGRKIKLKKISVHPFFLPENPYKYH